MKGLNISDMIKKIKISLILLIAVVFLAFYTLGYDMPCSFNPTFNEPMLTPAIIWLMIVMVVATLSIAITSAVIGFKKQNHTSTVNNIRIRRIAWMVAIPVAVTLAATFLLSNTDAITINGTPYNDTLWLRTSTMFIVTAFILIVGAIALILFSTLKRK